MTNKDHTGLLHEVRAALQTAMLLDDDSFDEDANQKCEGALACLDAFLEDVPESLDWAVGHVIVDPQALEDDLKAARTEREAAKLLHQATQETNDDR